jgi:hypothetical protein
MGIEDNLSKIIQDPDHPDHRELVAIFDGMKPGDIDAAVGLFVAREANESFADWCDYIESNPPTPLAIAALIDISQMLGLGDYFSARASNAAHVRHNQEKNHYPDSKIELLARWAGGQYSSRNACARKLCGELNLSEHTARDWLKGSPDPTTKK